MGCGEDELSGNDSTSANMTANVLDGNLFNVNLLNNKREIKLIFFTPDMEKCPVVQCFHPLFVLLFPYSLLSVALQ